MTARTELLKRAPRAVLPRAGQRVLCAVSGGLDSMCLLHMLDAWRRERDRTVTVWYQSEESLAAKLRLAGLFGVTLYAC